MNCKYCQSPYIYEMYTSLNHQKFYGQKHFTTEQFVILGCADCGKVTFDKRVSEPDNAINQLNTKS